MSKTNIGQDMEQFGAPAPFAPFTRVVLWYDDEHAFEAGDTAGRTLEADCPFATQEMADKILASIYGRRYQPYEAVRAVIDPAAELGDGVIANGVYSVLARQDTTFDALMVSDIAAPADEEIDHELPYETQVQRTLKRKMTLGQNYFGVQVTRYKGLEIVKTDEDGNEINRATFNTDVLAMYDDNGVARIYFDPATGRYKFVGDLDISGGSINMDGGSINWGDNLPDTGISASQARTIITQELVKSPTIAGGKFYAEDGEQYYATMIEDAFALMNRDSEVPRAVLQADSSMVELILGAGSDEEGINGRLYVQKGVEGGANVARVRYIDANGRYSTVEFNDTDGIIVESEAGVKFIGNVDFSGATVTGLTTEG